MKNKRPTFTHPPKMQGFSLIEFLVASALSMIVLMAVTSTYFTARNLNVTATSRLSAQQDLRGASTLLVRDARMAGSFGCFNMANHETNTAKEPDNSNPAFSLHSNVINGKMVPISENIVSYPDFFQVGNALIFQYGTDATGEEANIASSCNGIAKSSDSITGLEAAKSALNITDNENNGAISTLKHVVTAYAIGSFNEQSGLYRFQLDNNDWSEPQLLIKDISSMAINYLYINDISNCENLSSSGSQETFIRENSLRTADSPNLTSRSGTTPALIQLQLQVNNATAYKIEAAVRGGNVCANQSI